MLAVGAGWLGRELLIQTGQDMPAVVAESEAIPQAPEETVAFMDVLEEDVDPTSGEREARRIAAIPVDEPEIAAMQKSEGQKAAEGIRQDAAPLEAKVDRLEAAIEPERERDAVARLVEGGAALPTCYVAEVDLRNAIIFTPQELHLLRDGTALATAGGKQMSGTWVSASTDSVQVSLASGEAGVEMRLERTATGLSGTVTGTVGNQAVAGADAVAASPLVSIQLVAVECEAAP
jgi:hypothetical protein